MHDSFVTYKNYYFLKIASALCGVLVIFYLIHNAYPEPNGGSWFGYFLGILGAFILIWLSFLGVKKRRYKESQGNTVSWVSAHIYLGSALIIITTLHSGFQFALNIHFLGYFLTLCVVVTGFYGLYAYSIYPDKITSNSGDFTRDRMFDEIVDIDERCLGIAESINADLYALILETIELSKIKPNIIKQIFSDLEYNNDYLEKSISQITKSINAKTYNQENSDSLILLKDLLTEKYALLKRVDWDIRYNFRLNWWLYLHVPLTIALVAAVAIHIFVIFYYWW